MKLLKQLFDFYLDASIHVALAVVALLWVNTLYFTISLEPALFLFIFFSSIGGYIFIKYLSDEGKYRLHSHPYHQRIQVFGLGCSAIALIVSFFLDWSLAWALVLALLFLLTVWYALPIVPRVGRFRNGGFLKIVVVALVWAGLTVVLPVLYEGGGISWDMSMEFLQRIILVFVLMLPFEIRDMRVDSTDLLTFPRRYGVRRTKKFGFLLTFAFFLLTYAKDAPEPIEVWGKGILALGLAGILGFTKKEQDRYYAAFWVEAVPVFWGIGLWFWA